MPIKLPSDLPAFDVLSREGVMVMGAQTADRQDIRPLRIGLLNGAAATACVTILTGRSVGIC